MQNLSREHRPRDLRLGTPDQPQYLLALLLAHRNGIVLQRHRFLLAYAHPIARLWVVAMPIINYFITCTATTAKIITYIGSNFFFQKLFHIIKEQKRNKKTTASRWLCQQNILAKQTTETGANNANNVGDL
jgi:hypothetical protein